MFTPYLPYPLHSGGQTRSYNLIKHLSRKHDITLFSLIKYDEEKRYIPELVKFCKKVRVFKRPTSPWTLRNVLLTGFGMYPFLVIRNLSQVARKAVEEELAKEKYDLIHAETFYTMPHIPETHVPVLLMEQTMWFPVYRHFVVGTKWWFLKPLLYLDVYKIKICEKRFWRKAAKVVAVSDADKRVMERQVPGLGVEIVPNGIDEQQFVGLKRGSWGVPTALFVGNFTWMQNTEAVEYLVEKVWPKVRGKVRKASLRIVGQAMPEAIKRLGSKEKGVEVVGYAEDIRQEYLKANVLLAPIFGPGGTRLKILEAMAAGTPVVSTSVGVEGLGVKNGREVVICNQPTEMAEAVVKVFRNERVAARLSSVAKNFVNKNYSWRNIARKLDRIYQAVGKKD